MRRATSLKILAFILLAHFARVEVAAPQAAADASQPASVSVPETNPAPPPAIIAFTPSTNAELDNPENLKQRRRLLGLMLALIILALWHLYLRKPKKPSG
jgi:hypothetical protein